MKSDLAYIHKTRCLGMVNIDLTADTPVTISGSSCAPAEDGQRQCCQEHRFPRMGLSSQITPPENRQSHLSQEETYHASRATRTRNWKTLNQLQPRRKDIMRYPMVGYVLAMSLLAQISLKSQTFRGRCLGIGLQSPRCKRTYCSLLQQCQ